MTTITGTTYFGRRGAPFPNGEAALGFRIDYCNTGSVGIPVQAAMAANHPFVAVMVARESAGRMLQISDRSFCFHQFLALNGPSPCGPCSGGTGTLIGPACSEALSSGNLGNRFWLGPATEIDPWRGDWSPVGSYFDRGDPDTGSPQNADGIRSTINITDPVTNRLIVRETELQTAGSYYVATQLVVRGEAAANRGDNIAFRQFTPTWTGTSWQVPTGSSPTQNGTVLTAWSGASVGTGRNGNDDGTFAVGVKTTDLGGGNYHYEYAVHNIDNARGGASLRIPVPASSIVGNMSFRDIDANALNNWIGTHVGNEVVFTAPPSNPLDWNSIYNFGFDCNRSPGGGSVAIDQARIGPGALSVAVPARIPTGATVSTGGITINELVYDDGGFGALEFVELHNSLPTAVNLSGWILRRRTATGAQADLLLAAGTTIGAGAFLVAGGTAVPNRSVTFPTTNYLPDGVASLTLFDATLTQRDSVVYGGHLGVFAGAPVEGRSLFSAHRIESAVRRSSWSRYRDGLDTDDNAADFRVAEWTPGTTNDLALALPWQPNLDPLTVGSAVANWWGPQDDPRVVDPTVTSTYNPYLPPTPVPPPPGASRAMAFSTPNGAIGARSYLLRTDWSSRVSFDGYVWFDPTPAPAGQSYAWSLGVLGTTDSGYAMPDPLRANASESNGDTGVTWTYVATDSGTTLYLIDNAGGGRGHQVLASIPGPSGWQRLRLDMGGSDGYAWYGGTVGQRDGQLIRAGVRLSAGGVYVGYRSDVATGSQARALMIAQPVVEDPGPPYSAVGSGCQGSCPPKNPKASTVDDTAIQGLGTGDYALYVPHTGSGTFRTICVLSSGPDPAISPFPAAPTVSLFSAPGGESGQPGQVIVSASRLALLAPTSSNPGSPGWWYVNYQFTYPGPFYLVFHYDGRHHLPIAAEHDEEALEYADCFYQPTSGSWTNTTPRIRAWAWKFVCQDMAGRPKSKIKDFAEVGGSFALTMDDGGSSSIGIMLLDPNPLIPGFSLSSIGMPGCFAYVPFPPALSAAAFLDPHGHGEVPLTIPNHPFYLGLSLTSQWATPDPINSFGFVTTEGLTFTVQ
ncbi:MAG: lamin tail domain-containing protein [Planctomycetota bacterium]